MARHMIVTVLIVFGIYATLLFLIGHPFVAQASNPNQSSVAMDNTNPLDPVHIDAIEPERAEFSGPVIVGVSARVDLTNAEDEVGQVWQQLMDNPVLINNVNWAEGDVQAYAYFHDFDENMNQARLSIGFDGDDLLVNSSMPHFTLPSGEYEVFTYHSQAGTASEQAWASAYVNKNLIERHTLNALGESTRVDAIVVLK